MCHICGISNKILHVNHARKPHVNQDSFTFHTQFVTQFFKVNDQNSTWKSLHMSHNIFYYKICQKYIHIMGWKDQTSKEIATCGNSVSLSSCCEKAAAAGMMRAFPVYFQILQCYSTQCNNEQFRWSCMKCGISYEQIKFGEITVNWDISSTSIRNKKSVFESRCHFLLKPEMCQMCMVECV